MRVEMAREEVKAALKSQLRTQARRRLAREGVGLPELGAIRRELARRSLLAFTTYTFPGYQVNWHHALMASYLDRWVRGEIRRLMVFCPPRHGKSELVSRRLPAYVLGREPDAQIIACSYSSDLASRMNRDVQRIIEGPRYQELFPATQLGTPGMRLVAQGGVVRKSDEFEIVGQRGMYRAAGVGGGITGMGMQYGIIDDPIKNREEAYSQTYRDNLWEWYTSTFFTRLEKRGRILLTLTRWHHDDLAGRVLNAVKERDDRSWVVVTLPAVRDDGLTVAEDPRALGGALWPEKFSEEALEEIRLTTGGIQWESLYQQRPTPTQGALFQPQWLRSYEWWPSEAGRGVYVLQTEGKEWRLPAEKVRVFMTVDLAASIKTQADYTVVGVFGVTPQKELLVLDLIRARLEGPDHLPLIRRTATRWRPSQIGIEGTQYQLSLVQSALRTGLPVRALKADKDKVSRALPAAARMESGMIYVPAHAEWRPSLEIELAQFPQGSHDDQVDVLAYAVQMLNEGVGLVTAPLALGTQRSYWRRA